MPGCGIKKCGLRKNKNNPHLSIHSLPRNQKVRKKWLDVVGIENLSPDMKRIFICSKHFEKSCINTTLNVARLRDDAVPSLYLPPRSSTPTSTTRLSELRTSTRLEICPVLKQTSSSRASSHPPPRPYNSIAVVKTELLTNIQPSIGVSHVLAQEQEIKIKKLINRCKNQKKQIHRLSGLAGRRKIKINELKEIIQEMEEQLIDNEESLPFREYSGPEELVRRQMDKCKGLPLPNKYSDEIR